MGEDGQGLALTVLAGPFLANSVSFAAIPFGNEKIILENYSFFLKYPQDIPFIYLDQSGTFTERLARFHCAAMLSVQTQPTVSTD